MAVNRFGGGFFGADEVLSSDSEEDAEEFNYMDKEFQQEVTNTGLSLAEIKNARKMEKYKKKLKKLGPCSTYMSLIKGFTCVAILYLPQSYLNGGYGFANIASIFSGIFTLICIFMLLELRKKTGGNSFTEIGYICYGTFGKTAVNVSLTFCQLGYPVAFLNFMISNVHSVFKGGADGGKGDKGGIEVSRNIIGIFFFFLLTGICWIRKLAIFAKTNIFADIMILLMIVIVAIYGFYIAA